ncbi:bifunctional folylpolyglutamate synthase/dihydrofolate synthase [Compostimonas suwonensis]|uniref:tetrahydrofolate synthase n=1 Tax=Compostimonas suwonensis TaxID=1048394 RepID=A0A2M9BZE5_9MICO|nr:Mur ligase family protein [Compostimonas suwonensis]PJJ63452.1 dihydrofolate synthase/folylpolyglutamate synthase [Compostimonas suwonensis]
MTNEANDEFRAAGDAVYEALLERMGEGMPQPRLEATRRAVELLGDPQQSFSIVHLTGTNGKTSTSRLVESILRAYGLRTGLFTSPHLLRFNERIMIDGEPIGDETLAANWADIEPYLLMVDAELEEAGEPALTFFEAMTVLAFASFADAPVDVAVIEVGMGGEWDSTNVADGDVAVFTPISLDHTARLGNTIAEIAKTKSGIIKPAAAVVSAAQPAAAIAELRRAAELSEASLVEQGTDFEVLSSAPAVGGQLLSVRGLAGTYNELLLPLYGEHQAQNAAVAIAAVESFLGGGTQALSAEALTEGLATATSPGRLQLIGTEPPVLVDAAHNPAGAAALAAAVAENFDFDELTVVLGILTDKDAEGIVRALAPVASRFVVTQSGSERTRPFAELASLVSETAGLEAGVGVTATGSLAEALEAARAWAGEAPKRGVLVTGSITLIGDTMTIARDGTWSTR